MINFRSLLKVIFPSFLFQLYRIRKKKKRNEELLAQKDKGHYFTKDFLVQNLKSIGIQKGDSLLVHSSLSKMGYLENGPDTIIDALLEVIGTEGNLLMPSSPNALLQLNYIKSNTLFDAKNSPSKLGAITEVFRKRNGVFRSLNATEPVCALGPDAHYLTKGHFNELTPYTKKSPFYRLVEKNGKILYIGVTLANAGTSLHLLEDAVDFKYPVYFPEVFDVKIKDSTGNIHEVKTKVHNPEYSKKRKCDDLLPLFLEEEVCSKVKIGNADSYLFDSKKMFDSMLKNYLEKGITMYTPNSSN
jgi:aminoglycoside 3-N-acetyltransferase